MKDKDKKIEKNKGEMLDSDKHSEQNTEPSKEYLKAEESKRTEEKVTAEDRIESEKSKEKKIIAEEKIEVAEKKAESKQKSEARNEERDQSIGSKTETETDTSKADKKVVEEFRSISRRSFLGLGIAGILGGGTYYWLRSQSEIGGVEAAFRYSHQFNEFLAKKYFSHSRLAVEYPKSAVQSIRANGFTGLGEDFDADNWSLKVSGTQKSPNKSLIFSLEDIKNLPKQDISINFKCIEGWSRVMNYVGVRFSDFINTNKLFDVPNLTEYVSMATPDGEYYVGLDIESAMHPQTLLCYEMNGEALKPENGFPLRLLIPTKYGIKNLKRIGTITFTNERPDDYWAERGYDWYAGL